MYVDNDDNEEILVEEMKCLKGGMFSFSSVVNDACRLRVVYSNRKGISRETWEGGAELKVMLRLLLGDKFFTF